MNGGDEAALHHGIIANPQDITRSGVYADWLDEHGRPFQAAVVRDSFRRSQESMSHAPVPASAVPYNPVFENRRFPNVPQEQLPPGDLDLVHEPGHRTAFSYGTGDRGVNHTRWIGIHLVPETPPHDLLVWWQEFAPSFGRGDDDLYHALHGLRGEGFHLDLHEQRQVDQWLQDQMFRQRQQEQREPEQMARRGKRRRFATRAEYQTRVQQAQQYRQKIMAGLYQNPHDANLRGKLADLLEKHPGVTGDADHDRGLAGLLRRFTPEVEHWGVNANPTYEAGQPTETGEFWGHYHNSEGWLTDQERANVAHAWKRIVGHLNQPSGHVSGPQLGGYFQDLYEALPPYHPSRDAVREYAERERKGQVSARVQFDVRPGGRTAAGRPMWSSYTPGRSYHPSPEDALIDGIRSIVKEYPRDYGLFSQRLLPEKPKKLSRRRLARVQYPQQHDVWKQPGMRDAARLLWRIAGEPEGQVETPSNEIATMALLTGDPRHLPMLDQSLADDQHPLAGVVRWANVPRALELNPHVLSYLSGDPRVQAGMYRWFGTSADPYRSEYAARTVLHRRGVGLPEFLQRMRRQHGYSREEVADALRRIAHPGYTSLGDWGHLMEQPFGNPLRPVHFVYDFDKGQYDQFAHDDGRSFAEHARDERSPFRVHAFHRFESEPPPPPRRRRMARPINKNAPLGFIQSLRLLRSANQKKRRQIAGEIAKSLQLLPAHARDALHDTAGGAAVPGVAVAAYQSPDPATVRYAAAWLGLLTQTPSQAVFHVGRNGPDSVYKTTLKGAGEDVRQKLDRAGFYSRVLMPTADGFHIIVFDKGRRLRPRVAEFARRHGVKWEESVGKGEVIGGPDHASARDAYRRVIERYESGVPVQMSRRPVRYQREIQAHAAGIAKDVHNRLLSNVMADHLGEMGLSGAEEVVRRSTARPDERTPWSRPTDAPIDRGPQEWPEHWIREDRVAAMTAHPHGMSAWSYPSEERRLVPDGSYVTDPDHTQVALSVLGEGEPGKRHVVQYHTEGMPHAEAYRLLRQLEQDGVHGAEQHRRLLGIHLGIDEPPVGQAIPPEPWHGSTRRYGDVHREEFARRGWLRRFAVYGYTPQDVVASMQAQPGIDPVVADFLEENNLHADDETLYHLRNPGEFGNGAELTGDNKVHARPWPQHLFANVWDNNRSRAFAQHLEQTGRPTIAQVVRGHVGETTLPGQPMFYGHGELPGFHQDRGLDPTRSVSYSHGQNNGMSHVGVILPVGPPPDRPQAAAWVAWSHHVPTAQAHEFLNNLELEGIQVPRSTRRAAEQYEHYRRWLGRGRPRRFAGGADPGEPAFLHAILAEPRNSLHSLVYSDWLEEHDRPATAFVVRAQGMRTKPKPKGDGSWQLGAISMRHDNAAAGYRPGDWIAGYAMSKRNRHGLWLSHAVPGTRDMVTWHALDLPTERMLWLVNGLRSEGVRMPPAMEEYIAKKWSKTPPQQLGVVMPHRSGREPERMRRRPARYAVADVTTPGSDGHALRSGVDHHFTRLIHAYPPTRSNANNFLGPVSLHAGVFADWLDERDDPRGVLVRRDREAYTPETYHGTPWVYTQTRLLGLPDGDTPTRAYTPFSTRHTFPDGTPVTMNVSHHQPTGRQLVGLHWEPPPTGQPGESTMSYETYLFPDEARQLFRDLPDPAGLERLEQGLAIGRHDERGRIEHFGRKRKRKRRRRYTDRGQPYYEGDWSSDGGDATTMARHRLIAAAFAGPVRFANFTSTGSGTATMDPPPPDPRHLTPITANGASAKYYTDPEHRWFYKQPKSHTAGSVYTEPAATKFLGILGMPVLPMERVQVEGRTFIRSPMTKGMDSLSRARGPAYHGAPTQETRNRLGPDPSTAARYAMGLFLLSASDRHGGNYGVVKNPDGSEKVVGLDYGEAFHPQGGGWAFGWGHPMESEWLSLAQDPQVPLPPADIEHVLERTPYLRETVKEGTQHLPPKEQDEALRMFDHKTQIIQGLRAKPNPTWRDLPELYDVPPPPGHKPIQSGDPSGSAW